MKREPIKVKPNAEAVRNWDRLRETLINQEAHSFYVTKNGDITIYLDDSSGWSLNLKSDGRWTME